MKISVNTVNLTDFGKVNQLIVSSSGENQPSEPYFTLHWPMQCLSKKEMKIVTNSVILQYHDIFMFVLIFTTYLKLEGGGHHLNVHLFACICFLCSGSPGIVSRANLFIYFSSKLFPKEKLLESRENRFARLLALQQVMCQLYYLYWLK